MKFGENLKHLLAYNNMSQAQLAKKIDYSQRAISKWINCQSEPTATAIVKCAKFFEVSTDYLLGVDN